MKQQRLNLYVKWHILSVSASRSLIAMSNALEGKSVSEESMSEITDFFQSCKQGEEARLMVDMREAGLENVDKYQEVFRPTAKVLDTGYYLAALGKVEEGNKNSIQILKKFFSDMMHYCSKQSSKYLLS